jgi:hypothetical protein
MLLDEFLTVRPILFFDEVNSTWRDATEEEAPEGKPLIEFDNISGSYLRVENDIFFRFWTTNDEHFYFQANDDVRIEIDGLNYAKIEQDRDLTGKVNPDYNIFQIYRPDGTIAYRHRYYCRRYKQLFEADQMAGFSPESRAGDLTIGHLDFFHALVGSFEYMLNKRTATTLQNKNSNAGLHHPIRSVPARCTANQACPQTGYWFTPARENSRTHFEAGQTMPDVGGTWGATFWQWDEQQ